MYSADINQNSVSEGSTHMKESERGKKRSVKQIKMDVVYTVNCTLYTVHCTDIFYPCSPNFKDNIYIFEELSAFPF